ncbi:MAG: CRISPR-associated endonuclease Cas3'' [Treponema sp.]
MPCIARFRDQDGKEQLLENHLTETARLAASFGESFHFEQIAFLSGLIHDYGKYSSSWQQYLADSRDGKRQQKKDHATAGAQLIKNLFSDDTALLATALQAVIMYHHGSGLPDMIGFDGLSPFLERLGKYGTQELSDIDKNVPESVRTRITAVVDELKKNPSQYFEMPEQVYSGESEDIQKKHTAFDQGLHLRNFSSCLIDADRTDSAGFENNKRIDFDEPGKMPDWNQLLSRLEKTLASFSGEGELSKIRKTVSDGCAAYAEKGLGLYTLSAATGAGKTLASLRFALVQALKYHLHHIFIIAPYTSIIDQNAEVIRQVLEDEQTEGTVVLECHSNLSEKKKTALYDSADAYESAAETWEMPVIVTTMVQFLETLFGAGTQSIRRMHQLAGSVLVFDEIQTLPVKCTYLFNWGLEYLVDVCSCSALLCTATQPGLDRIGSCEYRLPLHPDSEVIQDVRTHFTSLKRVNIVDRTNGGVKKVTVDDIAAYVAEQMQSCKSFLAVVNTKPQAVELFELIKQCGCADVVYHLSTNMCPAHRKAVFSAIKDDLDKGTRIVCISTRLIEAGVDLSFDGALRYLAGLDSIVQTAGRCNRNGELRDTTRKPVCGTLAVFTVKDEKLGSLEELKTGQRVMGRVFREYHADESRYGNDIMNPALIESYFKYYYGAFPTGDLKYAVNGKMTTILDLLSDNPAGVSEYRRINNLQDDDPVLSPCFHQAFSTAWEHFEVIADMTIGVIVPYGKGKKLIGALSAIEKSDADFGTTYRKLLHEAQQYSVNVYRNQIEKLVDDGIILPVNSESDMYAVQNGFYDDDLGLVKEFMSEDMTVMNY